MFFDAAKQGHNEWWRYLLGVILVIGAYVVGQFPLLGAMVWFGEKTLGRIPDQDTLSSLDFRTLGMDQNIGFLFMMLIFVFALAGLWMVIRVVHGRTLFSLVGSASSFRWGRYLFGLGIWFLMGLFAEALNFFMEPELYTWQFEPAKFLPLLAISLLFIPLQTAFEELFVRGYIMQGIGLASNSRILAILLSSAVFAALHLMNPEIGSFGLGNMIAYYLIVATFLAVITLLDDGLELAMGIHAATNLFGSLIVTFEGSALQNDTLLKLNDPDVSLMLVSVIASCSVFFLLARWKFGWNDPALLSKPIWPKLDHYK